MNVTGRGESEAAARCPRAVGGTNRSNTILLRKMQKKINKISLHFEDLTHLLAV